MKIYKTQAEVDADIKNGFLIIDDDVTFECTVCIGASITARNITAWNITAGDITARNITAWDITAGDINAWDITAGDITAWDITAWDITAGDITAGDITAGDINAWDITAWDITAGDINARNIEYYAFCSVYNNIKCTSYKAGRVNHQEPICLDGKLEIINKEPIIEEMTMEQVCNALGKTIKIKKG